MTMKRYYVHKHLISEDKVHDKICHRFMNITETVEHMNMYYQKYTGLKQENEQLKQYKEDVFNKIDIRIRSLEANSKQCHQGGSHDKGIEFTLQAELLERLKKELE